MGAIKLAELSTAAGTVGGRPLVDRILDSLLLALGHPGGEKGSPPNDPSSGMSTGYSQWRWIGGTEGRSVVALS